MTTTRRNPSYIYTYIQDRKEKKNLDVYLSEEKKREKEEQYTCICIDTEENSL